MRDLNVAGLYVPHHENCRELLNCEFLIIVHVIENVDGKVQFPVKNALPPCVLCQIVLGNKDKAKPIKCA